MKLEKTTLTGLFSGYIAEFLRSSEGTEYNRVISLVFVYCYHTIVKRNEMPTR